MYMIAFKLLDKEINHNQALSDKSINHNQALSRLQISMHLVCRVYTWMVFFIGRCNRVSYLKLLRKQLKLR